MKTFLRCFANACQKKRLGWLPLAEFWYNTSYYTAIGCSPFQALWSSTKVVWDFCIFSRGCARSVKVGFMGLGAPGDDQSHKTTSSKTCYSHEAPN
jgi:hypothetical protein